MKRWMILAAILLLLCGCGEPKDNKPASQPETALQSEQAKTETAATQIPPAISTTPETVPPETETIPPETETVPPETETIPLETETVPPETETIPPETETVPPETETVPPETETIPPETETVPPETETNPAGTGASASELQGHPAGTTEPEVTGQAEDEYLADVAALLELPASPYAAHVYSHQGTSKEEDSETFAAYDLAIAYGSRYIEQDLMLSADGVIYCSHDSSPEALTGEKRLFSELTSEEIDALRTKSGKHRLLRLSSVFERYGTAVTYVIEIKDANTLEPFVELVRAYGMQDHIIVQSSSLSKLKSLEEIFPDMPKLFLTFNEEKFESALKASYVDIISVNGKLFSQEICDRVHAAGKQYNVAVVNSIGMIRDVIEMGVDSYFTDYTGKAFVLEALYRK